MYQLKDKVVYVGHGVAVIEDIIEKKVANRSIKFFKLQFVYKDMTILLPTSGNSKSSLVRHLSNPKEVERALNELYAPPSKNSELVDFTPSSWNKRNKDYQLKLQSGSLLDVAIIYRDLMQASKTKELSFGEKNLLQTAEELLLQEIMSVKNKDRETVIKELRSPFQQYSYQSTTIKSTSSTAS